MSMYISSDHFSNHLTEIVNACEQHPKKQKYHGCTYCFVCKVWFHSKVCKEK